MNRSLALLKPGDGLLVPNKTFHLMGGIVAPNLTSVTLRIDGTLAFSTDISSWPTLDGKRVLDCLLFAGGMNITITSSGVGTLNGNGAAWWGVPGIGYLVRGENRPKLIHFLRARRILVERLNLINSPTGIRILSTSMASRYAMWPSTRGTREDGHGLIDLSALNTDGFDVEGSNVHIHDCEVWNQDDSVCVKGSSENMLFERINASGLGLTVGSLGGGDRVRNITFRECRMHRTFKGIYLKFNDHADGARQGLMEDILYEDIVMEEPQQWPIWIGPAQQNDGVSRLKDICDAHPCSLCWPAIPSAQCNAPRNGTFRNITLRRVDIYRPKMSPGVLLAPPGNPATVTFDAVRVHNASTTGSGVHGTQYFRCEGFEGVALGGTSPVPPCFKERRAS